MRKFCLILLVFPILSFSQIDSESWKDYWNEQKKIQPKNSILNGFWEEYKGEKGGLKGRFKNGKRVGKWKDYYLSGELKSVGKYKNDEPDGLWKIYYPTGQRKEGKIYYGTKKLKEIKSVKNNSSCKFLSKKR